MTYEELKEKLAKTDEVTLLEWLDLTSEELVYYLDEVIEEKQNELREKFEDDDEEEE
jgi:hypothetical protein